MPRYAYVAQTNTGRTIKGVLEAPNEREARAVLARRGLISRSITPALTLLPPRPPNKRALAAFAIQLGSMLAGSVPLQDALEALAPSFRGELREAIYDLTAAVRSGTPLSQAMERRKRIFGDLLVGLAAAGEASGNQAEFLKSAGQYLKWAHITASKIRSALAYPAFTLAIALLVAYGLMVYIVPQFGEMLRETGTTLPLLTVIMLTLSDLASRYALVVLILLGVGLYFFNRWRLGPGKPTFDAAVLKLPLVGHLLQAQILAQLARLWALMDRSQIELLKVLEKLEGAVGNHVYQVALRDIRESVRQGTAIDDAFLRYEELFTPMLIAYIKTGATSSRLHDNLSSAAEFYEEDLNSGVETLRSSLEPVLLVFIGGIVLVILLSVLLPYFRLAMALT